MNNSKNFEGKPIPEKVVWHFYRYKVQITDKKDNDVFEWLYLSLFVYQNRMLNKDELSYDEDVKNQVKAIMLNKFSDVIDNTIITNVIRNSENDFIYHDKKINRDFIKKECLGFLSTYENLFGDNLRPTYIYQDAITGEVVPFFGDTAFLKNISNHDPNNCLEFDKKITKPSKSSIDFAYKQYEKLSKFKAEEDITEAELASDTLEENEILDQDFGEEEIYFGDDDEEFISMAEVEKPKKQKDKKITKCTVRFLNVPRVDFYLEVPIFVRDNQLCLVSPFKNNTELWLNKCLKKARNISKEGVDEKIKLLENKYLMTEKEIIDYVGNAKGDVADNLFYCKKLYRLGLSLKDNNLLKNILDLDSNLKAKNEISYFYMGNILENILYSINYKTKFPYTNKGRTSITYNQYLYELDFKLAPTNINYKCLKNAIVFNQWTSKKEKKDGEIYKSFKADVADLLISTNLVESSLMYRNFIEDIFDIYNKRNKVDHGNKITIDVKDAETLTKCVEVLTELL